MFGRDSCESGRVKKIRGRRGKIMTMEGGETDSNVRGKFDESRL